MKKSTVKKCNKVFAALSAVAILAAMFSVMAFAAGDVTSVLSNTANLLFTVVRIVGVILCLWGIWELAQSLAQHDGSARFRGIMTFAAGLLVVFAKEILTAIGVTM